MTDNAAHSWEFTPPKAMNTVMKTILRLPVLHRMMSSQILLLTFTGRMSGKQFTTPVGYVREGNTVLMLTKRFRKWWRNFATPMPVELLMEGKHYTGEARALTDEATITPLVRQIMRANPRGATAFQVRQDANGNLDETSLLAIVPKVVVVQVQLNT